MALLHVGLEEHRWRRRAWQVSQTLTGFGEAGRGSSLSEQLLQNISPQFRQWCCGGKPKESHITEILLCWVYGFKLAVASQSFENGPSVSRWRTPSHTAYSGWHPYPSTKPDPPETRFIFVLHIDTNMLTSSTILLMERVYFQFEARCT